MKANLKFRSQFLAFFMAVLIFSIPFITLAQQNSVEAQAKMAAERDAETDLNRWAWYIYGFACCLGVGLTTVAGAAIGSTSDGWLEFDDTIYGGCFGFIVGSAVSAGTIVSYKIVVPPERFLGKSPEYVDFYTAAYERKIRLRRVGEAAAGGITFCGLTLLISRIIEAAGE